MTRPARFALAGAATVALCAAATPALAHHAMGGILPSSPGEGLLSGLGHPIIGIDHLAFVAAVGIAAAFTPRPWAAPLAFVAATVAGCLLLLGGVMLPAVEFVIAASVVAVGGLILSGRAVPAGAYAALFALAGLFHGWAYGESIVGAEPTPLLAYLAGFAVIQFAIAGGIALAVRALARAETARLPLWQQVGPRLAGAVIAGIGLAVLFETVEGALLA